MRRRSFLAGGVAATALGAGSAKAAISCSQFDYNGIQVCDVGVRIGQIATARQRCQNWCWAACAEAIFNLHGYSVPQEEIVDRVYQNRACETATGYQIIDAISGRWQGRNGQRFQAQAFPLLDLSLGIPNENAAAQVAQELTNGNPLVNGAMGHATVLTAMRYLRDVYGRWTPEHVVVRDPWPGRQNRRVLTPQEAYGTFFIAAVHIL